MWYIILIPVIPIFYFIFKKKQGSVDLYKNTDKFLVKENRNNEKEEKNIDKKIIFKESDGVPIDYQKFVKLFLFCSKYNYFNNFILLKYLSPYAGLAQNFKIVKKQEKFYSAPIKKVDIDKCNKIFEEFDKKFISAKNYSIDKNFAKWMIDEFMYFLDTRVDIVRDNVELKDQIDFIITDNLNFCVLLYKNFKKKRINIKSVISNDDYFLSIVPKEIDKMKYKFFKNKIKIPDIPIYSDFINFIYKKIDEILPDEITNFVKKNKNSIFVSVLTKNVFLGLVVYLGQKWNEQKFNNIVSEFYGICGAIVAGIFSFGIGAYPAYKISKAQARFALEGGNIDVITKEIINNDDIKNLLKGELKKELDYDSIAFIESN